MMISSFGVPTAGRGLGAFLSSRTNSGVAKLLAWMVAWTTNLYVVSRRLEERRAQGCWCSCSGLEGNTALGEDGRTRPRVLRAVVTSAVKVTGDTRPWRGTRMVRRRPCSSRRLINSRKFSLRTAKGRVGWPGISWMPAV